MRQGLRLPAAWFDLLSLTTPPKRTTNHRRHGAKRLMTAAQLKQIVHLRESRGWSSMRIALHMKMKKSHVDGVIYGGCGARTGGV